MQKATLSVVSEAQDDFKVEKDFPIPSFIEKSRKYPLNKMEIGDSFLIERQDVERVRNAVTSYQRGKGVKFSVRKTGQNEFRCWRIA